MQTLIESDYFFLTTANVHKGVIVWNDIMGDFIRYRIIGIFHKCKKCGGKLNLSREGGTKIQDNPKVPDGWYHIDCVEVKQVELKLDDSVKWVSKDT